MLKIGRFKYFLLLALCLILLQGGCSTEKKITLDEAKMIALEDAPKYKSENSNFEIWKTEETSRGWVIMISSKKPMHEVPVPNIFYEVGKNGDILERENMAIAE